MISRVMELWQADVERRRRLPRAAGPRPRSDWTIRKMPVSDRPRERLTALGAEALSGVEILACLLGRGIAGESVLVTGQRLLTRFGSLQGIAQASIEQLASVRGVGQAKASALKAACELSRRVQAAPDRRSCPIESAEAAMEVARRCLSGKRREHFMALLLDARHRLLRTAEISIGTLDMSLVHPRETFREAIVSGAKAVILAHNHPSGDPAPSVEDLTLTRRLVEGGRLLGIPVLDHIIVGQRKCISLKTAGLWPEEKDA